MPADADRAHRVMTAPGVTTVVAAEGATVVGFACLQSDGEIQAHLSLIAVDADHRGRGIGRTLVGAALTRAGGTRVDLVTDSAEAFYDALVHRRMAGYRLYPPFDAGARITRVAPRLRDTTPVDVARQRLTDARVGRLATVTPHNGPHVVPCCFAVDDDSVYTAVDAKPKSTTALQRVANIASNPRASLLVDHYAEDWTELWWVRADGRARLTDSPAEQRRAADALRAKYPQYADVAIPGPFIVIDVDGWRSWP